MPLLVHAAPLAAARVLRPGQRPCRACCLKMLFVQMQPVQMLWVCKKARPNQVALCGANPGQERAV